MRSLKNTISMNGLPSTPEVSEHQIEAARYAVLRRLAPCLRHHMVRPLQPIGLIYGVMHHKLSAAAPDLQSIREEADKINEFAKAALDECADMATWLAPDPGVLIRVDAGVRQCVGLLATMLHFCGFNLDNQVEDMSVEVQRNAMRMVLSAALLELTDSMTEPANLAVSAAAGNTDVTIVLQVSLKGEGSVDRYEDGYRKLAWSDVEALAAAENVGLSRQVGQVSMRFPTEPAAQAPVY
ncbi:MAG: hypothetical protein JWP96_2350 [Polaromonas sp.]|jgi:hypothetical protein|nr:hypothetical protein [Polaromonas sp.]